MKCEDFLAAHESKNLWQRWQAARHAARCLECAAALVTAEELRRELAHVEPLTAALREMWTNSAEELAVRSTRRWNTRQWLVPALAAAAVLLLTISLVTWAQLGPARLKPKEVADITRSIEGSPETRVPSLQHGEASSQLSELLAHVERLQREIESTMKQAELLDARQQADRMIAIYNRW